MKVAEYRRFVQDVWTTPSYPHPAHNVIHTFIYKAVMHIYTTLTNAYGIQTLHLTSMHYVVLFFMLVNGICYLCCPRRLPYLPPEQGRRSNKKITRHFLICITIHTQLRFIKIDMLYNLISLMP